MKDKIKQHFAEFVKAIYNGKPIEKHEEVDLRAAFLSGMKYQFHVTIEISSEDIGDDEAQSKIIELNEAVASCIADTVIEKLRLRKP